MKVAFWDNFLGVRGTTVALYDYAFYNKTLLNNDSIVLYNETRTETHADVVSKFKKEFQVFALPNFESIDIILLQEKCDVLYVIEGGQETQQVSKVCKTLNHCVFYTDKPHGSVYAPISPWLNRRFNTNYPVVPHMISLPNVKGDLRKILNIPEEATVFGRHGGLDQFDIPYVWRTIADVVRKVPHIFFVFMNTRPFCCQHPQIIHINPVVNLDDKVRFINTCDAMIWARTDGETFGCAIGEFSTKNKPIFATQIGDLAHCEILGEKAFWYNEHNLKELILNFNKNVESTKDWNAYRDYEPEKVMTQFRKVFLQ